MSHLVKPMRILGHPGANSNPVWWRTRLSRVYNVHARERETRKRDKIRNAWEGDSATARMEGLHARGGVTGRPRIYHAGSTPGQLNPKTCYEG